MDIDQLPPGFASFWAFFFVLNIVAVLGFRSLCNGRIPRFGGGDCSIKYYCCYLEKGAERWGVATTTTAIVVMIGGAKAQSLHFRRLLQTLYEPTHAAFGYEVQLNQAGSREISCVGGNMIVLSGGPMVWYGPGEIVDSLAWTVEIGYFDRFGECFHLAPVCIGKVAPRWVIERNC